MGSGDLKKYCMFLSDAKLQESDNPIEAIAWENGFVPKARGLPADELEKRIMGSLPHIAHMVSRPRQAITAGESLLRRYDAAPGPYCLRGWQSDLVVSLRCTNTTKKKKSRRSSPSLM